MTQAPSEESLRTIAVEIASIHGTSTLAKTLAIGKLVLDRFYGGDETRWRLRGRNKGNSLRRLAVRPECPLAKSALHEAISLHVAVSRAPELATFEKLGASHIVAVLPLSPSRQLALLRHANDEQWSVRRLRQAVFVERRDSGERRGRPSASTVSKNLERLRGCLTTLETTVVDDDWPLSEAEGRDLRERLLRALRVVEAIGGASSGSTSEADDMAARQSRVQPIRRHAVRHGL